MASEAAAPDIVVHESRFRRLRAYNVAMGSMHLIQAIAILVLANDFALPVTATFLDNAPGQEPATLGGLFTVSVASGVALFAKPLLAWQVFAGTLAA